MRAVLQRVSRAGVTVAGETTGEIGNGILVFLGVSREDTDEDAKYLVAKTVNLRIFDDAEGKPNLSLIEIEGELLVVSQFTLYGDTRKGRRPSYVQAAPADDAKHLYEAFAADARKYVKKVETGCYQAMMEVELVNYGPVTILLDSKDVP